MDSGLDGVVDDWHLSYVRISITVEKQYDSENFSITVEILNTTRCIIQSWFRESIGESPTYRGSAPSSTMSR